MSDLHMEGINRLPRRAPYRNWCQYYNTGDPGLCVAGIPPDIKPNPLPQKGSFVAGTDTSYRQTNEGQLSTFSTDLIATLQLTETFLYFKDMACLKYPIKLHIVYFLTVPVYIYIYIKYQKWQTDLRPLFVRTGHIELEMESFLPRQQILWPWCVHWLPVSGPHACSHVTEVRSLHG